MSHCIFKKELVAKAHQTPPQKKNLWGGSARPPSLAKLQDARLDIEIDSC